MYFMKYFVVLLFKREQEQIGKGFIILGIAYRV